MDLHVPRILEAVVAVQVQVADADVLAVHEDVIGAVDVHVFQVDVAAVPEGLRPAGDLHVAQFDSLRAPEHLRGVDQEVVHLAAARVPEGGAGADGEQAVFDDEAVTLPEGIFAFEPAVDGGDVLRLLQGGFARVDGHVFQIKVFLAVKRPLAAEFLSYDLFHNVKVSVFS